MSFKVYKTNSHLINDNFNDYADGDSTGARSYHPGGWSRTNAQLATHYSLVTAKNNTALNNGGVIAGVGANVVANIRMQ